MYIHPAIIKIASLEYPLPFTNFKKNCTLKHSHLNFSLTPTCQRHAHDLGSRLGARQAEDFLAQELPRATGQTRFSTGFCFFEIRRLLDQKSEIRQLAHHPLSPMIKLGFRHPRKKERSCQKTLLSKKVTADIGHTLCNLKSYS